MTKEKQDIVYKRNSKITLRITVAGIFVNMVLTTLKLVAGIIFTSMAVIADAATNGVDILTSLLLIFALMLSNPKRDKKHNYGHEKVEPMAVLLLSIMLFVLGGIFVWQGIQGILNPVETEINVFLLGITVFSIIIKAGMYVLGMHFSKKTHSSILKADAKQSLSDSFASLAVLVGLVSGIFIGTNIMESIAVLALSLFVFKIGIATFKPAFDQLTDRAAKPAIHDKITKITCQSEGVIEINRLRTRLFGSQIFVELEIKVDPNLTVKESYIIAGAVHDKLELDEDLRIKDCIVVVVPHDN